MEVFHLALDNGTVTTVSDILTQGFAISMTPPISYGIVLGIMLFAFGVVGAWFKYKKRK